MLDVARGLKSHSLDSRGDGAQAPSLARWVALCAVAEMIGMIAAAASARISGWVASPPAAGWAVALALALVVTGGLVEGLALGLAQSVCMQQWVPAFRRGPWVLVTVAVAGLGWAVASAPAVLAGGEGSGQPALLPVLAGAALLGAAMGAVLGAAQASVLRELVPHPWRWVTVSIWSWALAMPVIFLGATMPSSDWPAVAVVLLGAGTGVVAGSVLGLVSGWSIAVLTGPPFSNRVVLAVLRSRHHHLLDRSIVGLRVTGRVSGVAFELPVSYAPAVRGVVVIPGHPNRKQWWRNLRVEAPIAMLHGGRWSTARAIALTPGQDGYDDALAAYQRSRPGIRVGESQPVVRITIDRVP